MAKIIIPERKIEVFKPGLEIDLEEGELILLLNGKRVDEKGIVNSAIVGVFNGILEEFDKQKYGGHYQDKSYIKMRGVRVIKPIDITRGLSDEYKTFLISRQIKSIYSPQDKIVETLQLWPGFEAHAEWVARLRKPYSEK